MKVRLLQCLFIASLGFSLTPLKALGVERLAVFYSSFTPAQEREKALRADPVLAGIDVSVFGKFSDFQLAIKSDPPTFLIVPASYAQTGAGCQPAAQFLVDQKKEFKYVVSSLKAATPNVPKLFASVGMVDDIDRAKTKEYLQKIFPSTIFKTINRVPKVEDLYPLLALENTDVILVQPDHGNEFGRRFHAPMNVVSEANTATRYPVVCVVSGQNIQNAKKFIGLKKSTLESLGFSGIEEYK